MAELEPEPVQLSVLGPIRAERGDEELALGGRRQQAVLARLIVAAGSSVTSDRLVDDLWGEHPPASATGTLQSYVSNLRRALGGGRPSPIERVGDGYRLTVPVEHLASVRFERLVAAATGPDAPAPEVRTELLDEALALWRGPALADFSADPWAAAPAARWEELRMTAEEARFQARLDAGAHALVVADLEAAVRERPLRQQLTVQLVTALYRCGRQAEALRAYEWTRRHLGEELGLEPSPELVRLAAQVADHDPDLLVVPVADGASAAPAPTEPTSGEDGPPVLSDADREQWDHPERLRQLPLPPAVAERRVRSEFVGREPEQAALRAAWEATVAGDRRASLVTLVGDSGMGKTRLAQQLARTVHRDDGAHVLWGRCASDHLIAYQPVVEAVRTALRSTAPGLVAHLAATRPSLGPLLPETAGQPVGAGRAERYEVFDALAELIGEVTAGWPVLLVVDDLQWADTATLSVLDHLLHHPRVGRLLVVATLRRPAGRATPEVDRFLADLRRDHRLEPIPVEGFDVDEVAALLAGQGVEAADDLARAVQVRTGGNPFFVEALAEHGAALVGSSDRELPDSVRDLLDQRLAVLDPDALRLLTAAAVIGLRVDLGVLAEVADADSGSVLDLVDVAVATGLLVEDEEVGSVTFPHALVRQALVSRLTRNREARLHLRVAAALEGRPAVASRWSAIAQHLLAAGTACPPDRAAAAATAAGHDALAVVADGEARRWAERALDVLGPEETPASAAARADALLLLARAQRFLGQAIEARATQDRLVALARRHGLAHRLADAAQERAQLIGGVGFTLSRPDAELEALLAEASEAVGDQEPALRARLLAWSSIARNAADQTSDQDRLSRAALDAVARVPDEHQARALSLYARRLAVGGPRHLAERLALITPLREAATGWREMSVVARVLAIVDLLEADRSADAEAEVEGLRAFVAPIGRPSLQAYVAFVDALFATLHGRLDEAEAHSLRGYELGASAHGENAASVWSGQLLVLARERGELGRLTDLVAQVARDQPLIHSWKVALAWCQAAAGDLDGARAQAHSMVIGGRLAIAEQSVLRYFSVAMGSEVAWYADDGDLARVLVREIDDHADRVAVGGLALISVGHLLRHHGLVLATAGDLDAGQAQLARAAERSAACGFPTWRARALVERATVLERRGAPGDRDLAAELRAEGEAAAAALGIAVGLQR